MNGPLNVKYCIKRRMDNRRDKIKMSHRMACTIVSALQCMTHSCRSTLPHSPRHRNKPETPATRPASKKVLRLGNSNFDKQNNPCPFQYYSL
jgi:hypothetical protein